MLLTQNLREPVSILPQLSVCRDNPPGVASSLCVPSETSCDCRPCPAHPRIVTFFTRHFQADIGKDAMRRGSSPAVEAVFLPPVFRAVRLNQEVQPLFVRLLIRFLGRLCGTDSGIAKGHLGVSLPRGSACTSDLYPDAPQDCNTSYWMVLDVEKATNLVFTGFRGLFRTCLEIILVSR